MHHAKKRKRFQRDEKEVEPGGKRGRKKSDCLGGGGARGHEPARKHLAVGQEKGEARRFSKGRKSN